MTARKKTTMGMQIDFLAHTRSAYFDYAWIHGLQDQSLEEELGRFIFTWLGNEQLAQLPPVSVFFVFRDRCFLMIGQESGTRMDPAKRPIFERALLMWDARENLRYGHLSPLLQVVKKRAKTVFDALPEDVLNAPRSVTALEVQMRELDREAEESAERPWKLPLDLTFEEIARTGLTVEVPPEWGFGTMIAPLGKTAIDPSRPIGIGHALTFANRPESAGAWMVSGDPQSDLPRVRNPSGIPVDPDALNQIRARWAEEDRVKNRQPERNEKRAAPQSPPSDDPDAASFQEAARLSRQVADGQRGGQGWGWNRRPGDGIPEAIKRLQFLIAPLGRLVGPDVSLAWQNLLTEIHLFYPSPSAGIVDEWMRRLLVQYRIVAHRGLQPGWRSELEAAHNVLYKLLEDMR